MNTIGNVTHVDFGHLVLPFQGRHLPPPPRLPADTLVEHLALGDASAADELKSRYGKDLVGIAETILGDEPEAERLVDLVFDEASSGWPPPRGQVRMWLRRLVRRAAYARRRARRELDA